MNDRGTQSGGSEQLQRSPTSLACPPGLPFGSPDPSGSPQITSDLLPACVCFVPDRPGLSFPGPKNLQSVKIKNGPVRNQRTSDLWRYMEFSGHAGFRSRRIFSHIVDLLLQAEFDLGQHVDLVLLRLEVLQNLPVGLLKSGLLSVQRSYGFVQDGHLLREVLHLGRHNQPHSSGSSASEEVSSLPCSPLRACPSPLWPGSFPDRPRLSSGSSPPPPAGASWRSAWSSPPPHPPDVPGTP